MRERGRYRERQREAEIDRGGGGRSILSEIEFFDLVNPSSETLILIEIRVFTPRTLEVNIEKSVRS